jgi:hypothetical protein
MLRLRKVTSHIHAPNAYRVVLKLSNGTDVELGSIGEQIGNSQRRFWAWGLDTVLPPQGFQTDGEAPDRESAMAAFKAMWERYASDQDRVKAFLRMKLQRLP